MCVAKGAGGHDPAGLAVREAPEGGGGWESKDQSVLFQDNRLQPRARTWLVSRCRTEPGEWHLGTHSSPLPELSRCHTESPTPLHWLHLSGESWSQPHSHTGSRPSLPIAGDDGPSSLSKGTPKGTRLGVGAPSLL